MCKINVRCSDPGLCLALWFILKHPAPQPSSLIKNMSLHNNSIVTYVMDTAFGTHTHIYVCGGVCMCVSDDNVCLLFLRKPWFITFLKTHVLVAYNSRNVNKWRFEIILIMNGTSVTPIWFTLFTFFLMIGVGRKIRMFSDKEPGITMKIISSR